MAHSTGKMASEQQNISADARTLHGRPTAVRWQVMSCITWSQQSLTLDRLNLGVAAKFIQDEFAFEH